MTHAFVEKINKLYFIFSESSTLFFRCKGEGAFGFKTVYFVICKTDIEAVKLLNNLHVDALKKNQLESA